MSARSEAAIVVHNVLHFGKSLEKQLQLTQQQLQDDRDKALLRTLCSGVLRYHQSLGWQVDQMMTRSDKKGLLTSLLEVGIFQIDYLRIPDYSAVSATVEAAKSMKLPEKVVNGILRRYLREKETWLQRRKEQQFSELPKWFENMLRAQWNDLAIDMQKAYQVQAPMVLRNNPLQQSALEYIEELKAAKNEVQSLYFENSLLLNTPIKKKNLPRWDEGVCSVQSLCSQTVVEILQPKNDEVIMDVCSAPGNKSLNIKQIAPLAKLHSIEIDTERTRTMQEQFKRYSIDVNVIEGDATNTIVWPSDVKFDAIIVDAPCSATGTIRHNPDIKWLRRESDLQSFASLQKQLLDVSWSFLKSGGRLVYSTCSVLKQENEWQLKQWLKRHPDAQQMVINLPFGIEQEVGWQVFPNEQALDGFYYCLLQKKL